jgi:D-sedoheptulose 7-phosphate isomerase
MALRVAIYAVLAPRRDKAVIDRHLISLAIALQHIDDDVPKLQAWGRAAAEELAAGGRLFACGTGTSAQQARHLVSELASPEDERPPLAAATLPVSSGAHNDCQPGDVVLYLSATEADEGIAAAAAEAGEQGATSWALTGPAPNALAAACTEAVCVGAAVTSTVEEVHLAAIHILGAALNSAVRDAIRAGQAWPIRPCPAVRSGRPAA